MNITKNKTILMTLIDTAMENIVWVSENGATISLKDAIHLSIKEGRSGKIEDLTRNELLGAYTSCQINRQQFTENSRNMDVATLSERIKLYVFEDAREQMELLESEIGAESETRKIA